MQNQTDASHLDTGTGEILDVSQLCILDLHEECSGCKCLCHRGGLTGYETSLAVPIDDELLLSIFAAAQQEAQEAQDRAGKLEQELMRRAAERGATTIFGNGMKFVVETPEKLDITKLPPLLEYLTPEEKEKCYIPAHEEIIEVEAKWPKTPWNMAVRAHGGEFAEKVKEATFPGKASGRLVKITTESS